LVWWCRHGCGSSPAVPCDGSVSVLWAEAAARAFEPAPPPRWATPGALAQAFDPKTRQTSALELIDRTLVTAFNTADARVIITMPPQEGKSQRASRRFPLWCLTQNPDLRIAIASYESGVARGWGRAVRNDITSNAADLNLRVRPDVSAQHEWQLDGHEGGVYSVGLDGALTGRPVDVLIIDDPVKGREQADSPTYRERAWDFWQETAATRLAPGAPVVLILTRWHEDDLAGRLLAAEDGHLWTVISIPAQCENAETDPLGRAVGEFMDSARGRTQAQWEAIKIRSTTRTWSALYQQHPAPVEGAVWKSPWIDLNRGKSGDFHPRMARVGVGVDPATTSKDTSDETGIVVAGLDVEGYAWVLDDRSGHGTPVEWATRVWNAVLDWGATEVVIEDNQGGEMVLEVMRAAWKTLRARATRLPPPVRRVHAVQSKRVRAESVAAFYEIGRVRHAADGTDRLATLEDQMVTWTGDGASPDRIDALVHVLTALLLPQHSEGGIGTAPTQAARWSTMRGR